MPRIQHKHKTRALEAKQATLEHQLQADCLCQPELGYHGQYACTRQMSSQYSECRSEFRAWGAVVITLAEVMLLVSEASGMGFWSHSLGDPLQHAWACLPVLHSGHR